MSDFGYFKKNANSEVEKHEDLNSAPIYSSYRVITKW